MTEARRHALILLVTCLFMFWWRLGTLPLIDPDEPFYAQTTREMVKANDWVTPQIFGKPQFEKPIMFYWQTMAAQIAFGDNAFAARVPSALAATLLVFLTWRVGRRMFNPRAGFYAALVLATGMEYAFMSRLMLTDISLALFITASVYFFWLATEEEEKRDRWILLHLAASGCAALTKGPIGLLIPTIGSFIYLRLTHKPSPWRGRGFWLGVLAWLAIVVPWYGTMFAKFGMEYWHRFFVHENWERLVDAEHDHSNHFWYYPMILFAGSLPWIPLLVASAVHTWRDLKKERAVLFLVWWIIPNIIFFTIAQSKLPTYVFFLFVALALLMGRTLDAWLSGRFTDPARSGERLLARIFAAVQTIVCLAGAVVIGALVPADSNAFIQDLKPVIYSMTALMAVPMALIFLGRIRSWATATALGSAGIFALALTLHPEGIAMYASTRDIAAQVPKFRKDGEPIISAPFLARAVTYYTGEIPAGVAFLRDGNKRKRGITQPYFTPHPLNFLLDDKGVAEFVAKYPSALFVTQIRDRERMDGEKSVLKGRCEELVTIGDRCLFRISTKP